MNLVDPADFVSKVLRLEGFWKMSVSDKVKVLVIYPFVLYIFLSHLIPYMYHLVKQRFKKKKE